MSCETAALRPRRAARNPACGTTVSKSADLSKIVHQADDAMLAPRNPRGSARVKPGTLPNRARQSRLGVPYAGLSKFVARRLNYTRPPRNRACPIRPGADLLCRRHLPTGPSDDVIQRRNSTKLAGEVETRHRDRPRRARRLRSKALD